MWESNRRPHDQQPRIADKANDYLKQLPSKVILKLQLKFKLMNAWNRKWNRKEKL